MRKSKTLFLFVLFILVYASTLIFISRDYLIPSALDNSTHYFPAAGALLRGDGLESFSHDAYRGPGYPLLLASVSVFFRSHDLFAIGKIISITSSILFLLFAFGINQKVLSNLESLLVCLLVSVNPIFIRASIRPLTDMVFAGLVLGALYLLVVPSRHLLLMSFISGLISGYAYLIRYPAIFFLPAGALILISQKKWKSSVAFAFAFFSVVTPWLIGNYKLNGSPFYSRNFTNLHPSLTSSVENIHKLNSIAEVINASPLEFVRNWIERAVFVGPFETIFQISGTVLGILALIGFAITLSRVKIETVFRKAWWIVFPIFYWIIISIGRELDRLFIPLMPFIFAGSVYAVFVLFSYVSNPVGANIRRYASIFILLILAIFPAYNAYASQKETSRKFYQRYHYLLDLADYLNDYDLDPSMRIGTLYHSRAISVLPGIIKISAGSFTKYPTDLSNGDLFIFEPGEAEGAEEGWARREGFFPENTLSARWNLEWQVPGASLYRLATDHFVEDFEYSESPLIRGWSVTSESGDGILRTDLDHAMQNRVLQIISNAGKKFRADFDLHWLKGKNIKFDILFGQNCSFYVTADTSEVKRFILSYTLTYDYPQISPNRKSALIPLKVENDGRWHKIERNVETDIGNLTGQELLQITGLLLRGSCTIDNIEVY